jgi:competence protein ComEA
MALDDDPAAWDPRPVSRLRSWFGDLLDTTGVGLRAAVAGVALLSAIAGAGWWLTRQAPPPVEASLPLVQATVPATTTTEAQPVVVHVAGAVIAPGVRRLPHGSRVVDAVDASGGLAADAEVSAVNLAALLVDGVQVYVPRIGEAPPAGGAPAGGARAAGDGMVDLNNADVAALETLPGVGPSTAAAIVDHRERHGPFASVDALLDVRGIGEAKLAAIRDLVRV